LTTSLDRIKNGRAKVAIIGLGYVGLPLAAAFASKGFETIGIDLNKKRVSEVNSGKSYITDVDSDEISALVKGRSAKLRAYSDFSGVKNADAVIICVPTPLNKNKEPNMSYVMSAAELSAKNFRKGQLIILESTTYPGTTEEIILPLYAKDGLKAGRDFYLAFSPERVDPGNQKFKLTDIPKVVGGMTPKCTKAACDLYLHVYPKVHKVSSPRVAEMEKLLENIFRNVNIAMVNELALLCRKMNIDVWEVIEAAKTKPYGFMAFYPGPGLGGHCIPVDPFYLSWKSKEYDMPTKFIELAGQVNDEMPGHIVHIIKDALNDSSKCLKGSSILLLGMAYKKDINDVRESPALKIFSLLEGLGAKVSFNDPYVASVEIKSRKIKGVRLSSRLLSEVDCAVLVTDHSDYDYDDICRHVKLLVDTRNAIGKDIQKKCRIVKI